MNNKQLEEKISSAFEASVPNIFQSVAQDAENQQGKVIIMNEKKKNFKPLVAIAACFIFLCAGLFVGIKYAGNAKSVTTVSLDVNPSIEIKINSKNVVTDVDTLNKDAEKVLGDMDLEGSKIDVAINAVIGSMLRNGYLSEISNSVLVSVAGGDSAKNAQLQSEITKWINDTLKIGNIDAAVISQEITSNSDLQSLADKANVSLGKAQLVMAIVKADPTKKFDELITLPINDLYLIIEELEDKGIIDDETEDILEDKADNELSSAVAVTNESTSENPTKSQQNNVTVPGITHSGTASEKAYISRSKALEIALSAANLTKSQLTHCEIDLDFEDGKMVYDVELKVGYKEYDLEIDAVTGEILKKEFPDNSTNLTDNSKFISKDEATAIALKAAGISAENAKQLKAELDRSDSGTYKYEVDFKYGIYEYEYDIDAVTGKIIKSEKEIDS